MAIDLEEPMLMIEHDHTRLDLLLEDLEAVARQGLNAGDEELLQDARTTWSHLYAEIARHFGNEERKIFQVLSSVYPELKGPLDQLTAEHRVLRTVLTRIGQMLEGSVEEVALRRGGFDEQWQELTRLWTAHADMEWTIFQDIHTRLGALNLDPLTTGSSPEVPPDPAA